MTKNSDLEKWQKAIQGIEAGQKDLSPEELSAYYALKGLADSGSFESNQSAGNIKVIKNALSSHNKHRLLKVHLTNFVALCEKSFTNKSVSFAQPQAPIFAQKQEQTLAPPPELSFQQFVPPSPMVEDPPNEGTIIEQSTPNVASSNTDPPIDIPIFRPPTFQPPTFQPSVNQESATVEEPKKEVTDKKPFLVWIIIGLVVLGVGAYYGYPFVKDFITKKQELSNPVMPDEITLNKTFLSFMDLGDSKQLIATVLPEEVSEVNQKVIWESEDATVASVDSTGIVTAIASGSTIISASTVNGLTATCSITVEFEITPDTIILDKPFLSFNLLGLSGQLIATLLPADVTQDSKMVTWTSSDTSVVTVDSKGIVTAIASGNAIISAYTVNGHTATCPVTVKNDNAQEQEQPQPPSSSASQSVSSGTVSVTGGSYTGELKNGQPYGMGTIRYNSRTLIDSRDTKNRYAEAGQSLTGQFRDGRLLQGRLFDRNGNQIETIIIGGGAY